jgi:hypothetical protein
MLSIISKLSPSPILASLSRYGFTVITLPEFPKLPREICGHVDMLCFVTNTSPSKIITSREYYELANGEFSEICNITGAELILSDEVVSPEYPECTLFNAKAFGSRLLCRKASVSEVIVREFDEFIDTNQGYAACSTLKLTDNAAITADRGIYSSLTDVGIDTLLIEPGHIDLPGHNYGFIGGASGVCGNIAYFAGNVESHLSYNEMLEFASKYGVSLCSLTDDRLTDIGGILFIG